jgi:flagellar hook assembly protein FlgD
LYPAGTYDIAWDGTNSAGAAMPDGAYLVQLKACGEKRVGVVIIERP